jgi:hypothetical protein
MGNPSQIAGAGMGATAGGSILSAFGALSSGVANSNMYNYQSGVAKLNQQIDTQNAEFARQTGEQQARQFGFKASAQMGAIKVAQASGNFDVRSGSDKQVQDSQRALNTIDLDTIRSTAAKTAYGFTEQGAIAGSQASLYSSAAGNALAAGGIGAASSILGGASWVSSMWLKGQQVGMFGGGGTNQTTGSPVPQYGAS